VHAVDRATSFSRGANSASKSSGASPGRRYELEGLAQRLVRVEAADQDLGDLASRDDTVAGIAGLAAVTLEEDEPVLVRTVVVEPAGRTIVYGNPLARMSRSERRFQSWASVARLYVPVRFVTPMDVISAILAVREPRAFKTLRTPP
jgi:hypothetical protein